jgi:hypothetical protein
MPRRRERVCLQDGLKLDLNWLMRQEIIQPGVFTRPVGLVWTRTYTGERIASGGVCADVNGSTEAWLHVHVGQVRQRIKLIARPRHFGGRQWYFLCPDTGQLASVLWLPLGARHFACRATWGRQVAYSSQFSTRTDRAHQGQAKIKSRLCLAGGFDPGEWDLPPKPKWMRWRTYNRATEKFDRYETILNEGIFELMARLGGEFWD